MHISRLTGIFALPEDKSETNRRTFLKIAGGAGAGLILGMNLPLNGLSKAAAARTADTFAPNPFVAIAPDNTVTIIIKHLDKGQGAATGLATLVAEELDAGWDQIRTEFAPADPIKYKNLAFGVQGVGGSTGLANSYDQYRRAGATAKAMLVAAAARAWSLPASEIVVKDGKLSHASGKTATFGELADRAAEQSVPETVTLKDPKDWIYIGKKFPRVDSKAKSTGHAKFTIDQQFDGMVYAAIVRPPLFGAKVKSFDMSEAQKLKGFITAFPMSRGVAVIADSTWVALEAKRAITVTWDDSKAEKRSSADIIATYKAQLDKPGLKARKDGDIDAAFKAADKIVEVDFEFPYLAHAPMEPLDCVVRYDGASAEIWTGSQLQTVDHGAACKTLGLKPEAVQLHTVWAGGSFGRRAIADAHFVVETSEIARIYAKPVPIKMLWSREDDVSGGYYRPIYVHRIRAGIDKDGKIVAWLHRIVGQSIIAGTPFASAMIKDGIDASSVEGASTLPYAIPALHVELHTMDAGVPVLWWRSVGSTHTAHATEHMIDILARETGKDPVAYRLDMLKDKPRHAGALKRAAEEFGWPKAPAAGKMYGAALHESFRSYVANIAEVSLRDDGTVKVERVVCAIDCGIAVNPDVVVAQTEGGLGYGLSPTLKSEITLKDGAVEQTNFDTYEVIRMSDMPKVEVHIVPSAEAPTGVGEPGTPVVSPAVANALLAGTAVRTTVLPMSRNRYREHS